MKRLGLAFLFAGFLFACTKNSTSSNNSKSFHSSLQTQAGDMIRLSTELDAAFNDVDAILGGDTVVCGGGITVDSVDSPRVISISYGTSSCNPARSRSGTLYIVSAPGTNWTTPGDSVIVSFNKFVVYRVADGTVIVFNGNFVYYNNSGGALSGLAGGGTGPLIHTITGSGITVTYDDSAHTSWRFTRQRSYTYNSGLVIATTGLDSAGSIVAVSDWGANRFGNSLVVSPLSPLVISQSCNWQLTGGQATLSNPIGVSTLTLGLDSTGKATGCPVNGGHFYYKLDWTGNGESPYTTIQPY